MATAVKLPRVVQDLDDYAESLNVLFYGDTGCGKTAELGTLRSVLILASEPGTDVIKRFRAKYGLSGKTYTKVWPIRSWANFEEAYKWIKDNPSAFEWIAFDTLTSLQQRALRAILEKVVKDNPSRDPDIPAIQDHQKWQNIIKRFVTDFIELPVNTIWTAQAMQVENQEGDDIVVPLILGKDYGMSAWVCAQMGVLGYVQKRNAGKGKDKRLQRVLITSGSPPYTFSKDRSEMLRGVEGLADGVNQTQTLQDILDKIAQEPAAIKRAARNVEYADDPPEDDEIEEGLKDPGDPDTPDDGDDFTSQEISERGEVVRKKSAPAKKAAKKAVPTKGRFKPADEGDDE